MLGLAERATEPVRWSAATRVSFRCAVVFGIFSAVRFTSFIAQYLYFPAARHAVSRWLEPLNVVEFRTLRYIGAAVIRLTTGQTGTALQIAQRYSYPVCYMVAVLTSAAVLGLVWSTLDRRSQSYPRMNCWLRVYARYALALTMLLYALVKVVPTQFGFLTPADLLRPLGGLNRFWVLWNFMVVSTGYTVFTGLAEVLGCVLLLFRRTTAAGALLVGAALINVLAIDIAYGVIGAAMIAALLLGLDAIVVAPYLGPLAKVLLLGRTERMPEEPTLALAGWRYTPVVKIAMLLLLIGIRVADGLDQRRTYFGKGQGLYGVFDVERFVRRGVTLTASATDGQTWKRIASDGRYGSPELAVFLANGEIKQYRLTDDVLNHRWLLLEMDKTVATLTYSREKDGTVIMRGELASDPVELSLHSVDLQSFVLMRPR